MALILPCPNHYGHYVCFSKLYAMYTLFCLTELLKEFESFKRNISLTLMTALVDFPFLSGTLSCIKNTNHKGRRKNLVVWIPLRPLPTTGPS